jgi:hypothetical protein
MVQIIEEILVSRDGTWSWLPINEVWAKSCKAHKKSKPSAFMADPRYRIRRG